MIYVLDSSAALKWVLPEPLADKARRLRDDYQAGTHQLLAPDLLFAEAGHALTRAERKKIIPVGDSTFLLADLLSTSPRFHPFGPLVPRALTISSQTRQGFYDCLYVALAERESAELVTADDKLVKNLQPQFPFIVALASLP